MATKPWRTFLLISVGVFASALDLFIVNITFPDLERDFPGVPVTELSWVLNGYAVVFAALLVAAGRVADLYGSRRWFVIGMALFTVSSAACAVAPSAAFLIGARIVQGAGAAILTPASLGVILHEFPDRARAGVYSAWAAIGAVGAVAGPPLGGLLVQASWRWVFVVNVPLGLVSVWYAARRVGEVRDPDAHGLPDLAGTVQLTAGIGALVLALVYGRDWGWTSVATLSWLAVALVTSAAAVIRSRSHPVPVLELPILRTPAFSLSTASATLFSASFAASLLAAVLWLTQVWSESILRAGLQLAAGPLAATVFAASAAVLAPRIGMPAIGAIGCLLTAAGAAFFLRAGLTPDYWGAFLPGLLILGAGVGLALPAFTAVAVDSVRSTQANSAIGISSMFRQVGVAVGVAVFVGLVGSPDPAHAVSAFRGGWIFMIVVALAGSPLMLAARFTPVPAAGSRPPDRHDATMAAAPTD